MPEFILDTSGVVTMNPPEQPQFAYLRFSDLDAFTQGYIEALFFTSMDDLQETAKGSFAGTIVGETLLSADLGFSDLAPEALARIIDDCVAFQSEAVNRKSAAFAYIDQRARWATAGRDFWYTRNGHGCGFWDGDWPEPYATELTAAAKAFGEAGVYLGADGKIQIHSNGEV